MSLEAKSFSQIQEEVTRKRVGVDVSLDLPSPTELPHVSTFTISILSELYGINKFSGKPSTHPFANSIGVAEEVFRDIASRKADEETVGFVDVFNESISKKTIPVQNVLAAGAGIVLKAFDVESNGTFFEKLNMIDSVTWTKAFEQANMDESYVAKVIKEGPITAEIPEDQLQLGTFVSDLAGYWVPTSTESVFVRGANVMYSALKNAWVASASSSPDLPPDQLEGILFRL